MCSVWSSAVADSLRNVITGRGGSMSTDNRITARFVVPAELSDRRLDQAVAQLMPEHSRSRLQTWIRAGALTVNGESLAVMLKGYQTVRLAVSAE